MAKTILSARRPKRILGSAALACILLAGAANAQASLGLGMLRKPVDVTVKNASSSAIVMGFSKFIGLDEVKDCVEEVFELGPGQSRTYPGIAYGPCFYYAAAKESPTVWGGKCLWTYQGFPGDTEEVFAKAFYLDQDESDSQQRTISLSESNAWINDEDSFGFYRAFMQYQSNIHKWKYMVEFVPCGPNEERSLEAVNRTSYPLRLFSAVKTYDRKTFEVLASVPSSRILPKGGTTVFAPRADLPPGRIETLGLSACDEAGLLYWKGTENVEGKPSDFGAVVAPKMAIMPLLKGCKTVMSFADDIAMGSGRYRFIIINGGSHAADVDIWYDPYPGDGGHVRQTLAPGKSVVVVSPGPNVSWEGKVEKNGKTYVWKKSYLRLKDQNAYGGYDSFRLGD